MALDENGKFIDKGRRPETGGDLKPGLGAKILQYVAIALFIGFGAIALTATSLFVCTFFTGLMAVQAVLAVGANIVRRLQAQR